jgi:hypothetical protein
MAASIAGAIVQVQFCSSYRQLGSGGGASGRLRLTGRRAWRHNTAAKGEHESFCHNARTLPPWLPFRSGPTIRLSKSSERRPTCGGDNVQMGCRPYAMVGPFRTGRGSGRAAARTWSGRNHLGEGRRRLGATRTRRSISDPVGHSFAVARSPRMSRPPPRPRRKTPARSHESQFRSSVFVGAVRARAVPSRHTHVGRIRLRRRCSHARGPRNGPGARSFRHHQVDSGP